MKLLGILDTEANRAVAYGGENSLACYLEPQIRQATFKDAVEYILDNGQKNIWLANEVRSYLKQCNESTIFLDIDCYNAEGDVIKRNARLQEKIEDFFIVRENEGRIYECLEMVIKLVSAVG